MKRIIVLTCLLLLFVFRHSAQTPSTLDSLFSSGDSTRVMDSLMAELNAFLDSATASKSFFSVTMGVGNRTFSVKNNSLNTQATTTRLALTPGMAYYHKSGLGIAATGFLSFMSRTPNWFQFAVTPSYDFISNKVAAGVSYTRYLDKDTSIANVSPYVNDWVAYFNYKRKSWRFGISFGYANGSFDERLSYRDLVKIFDSVTNRRVWRRITTTVNSNTKIKDLSVLASVRKDWEWIKVLQRNDALSLLLTSYLVTGTSRINTSGTVNFQARNINLRRFNRTFNTVEGTDFQVQSAAFSAGLFYAIGRFSIQPVWFIDYYFPETNQRVNQVFSVTAALNF
jgi:hypothetical protein